jgi:signal peptidase I
VIGIPGDRLKIVDQYVYLNGKRLNEPYVARDPAAPYDPFGDNFPPRNEQFLQANMQPEWADQILSHVHDGEIVVPPDKYFAMGDNRDHSWDSRFWGFVDRDAIMGRPVVIYWSVQGARDEEADRSLNGWLLNFLDTLIHLPSRTRWPRMLHEVH